MAIVFRPEDCCAKCRTPLDGARCEMIDGRKHTEEQCLANQLATVRREREARAERDAMLVALHEDDDAAPVPDDFESARLIRKLRAAEIVAVTELEDFTSKQIDIIAEQREFARVEALKIAIATVEDLKPPFALQRLRALIPAPPPAEGKATRFAAVSLIEDVTGRMLCVWNKRYNGWSLPGGMVEDGETPEQGQARELREETGLDTVSAVRVFEGEHGIESANKRGGASRVVLFAVVPNGEPRAVEDGCPIRWMTRDEFLAESPFATFYRRAFAEMRNFSSPPPVPGIPRIPRDGEACTNIYLDGLPPPPVPGKGKTRGFYVASKTRHAEKWKMLRESGEPIISTWIDEAGEGETTSFVDLWRRCVSECQQASALVAYAEEGDVLKGAFVEIGVALGCGVPVFVTGPIPGSFVNHPLVTQCMSLLDALNRAHSVPDRNPSPPPPVPGEGEMCPLHHVPVPCKFAPSDNATGLCWVPAPPIPPSVVEAIRRWGEACATGPAKDGCEGDTHRVGCEYIRGCRQEHYAHNELRSAVLAWLRFSGAKGGG